MVKIYKTCGWCGRARDRNEMDTPPIIDWSFCAPPNEENVDCYGQAERFFVELTNAQTPAQGIKIVWREFFANAFRVSRHLRSVGIETTVGESAVYCSQFVDCFAVDDREMLARRVLIYPDDMLEFIKLIERERAISSAGSWS